MKTFKDSLRMAVIISVLSSIFVLVSSARVFGQESSVALGAVQRIYSAEITNKAWTIDKVFVRSEDNTLYDPTGTYVKYADVEYLKAVNEGMSQVLEQGSNAFVKAEADFYTALSNTPPLRPVRIQMVTAPNVSLAPEKRVPYGLLVKEEGQNLNWFLSSPFGLKPNIVRRLITVNNDATIVTNFEPCVWTDYKNDATGVVANTIGDYSRTIRMEDPTVPNGLKIVRNSHLHWGHPQTGIDWGSLEIAFADEEGNVRYPLTGVNTARVNGVTYEFKLKCGATTDIKEVQE